MSIHSLSTIIELMVSSPCCLILSVHMMTQKVGDKWKKEVKTASLYRAGHTNSRVHIASKVKSKNCCLGTYLSEETKSIPSTMLSSVSCLPLVETTTMYRVTWGKAVSRRTACEREQRRREERWAATRRCEELVFGSFYSVKIVCSLLFSIVLLLFILYV